MKLRRDSGFTLIEVLVSFTILALSLGAVSASLSSSLTQARAADDSTALVLEARSLLAGLGADIPLVPGQTEGRLSDGGTWVMTIAQLPVADARRPLSAFDVALTVESAAGRSLSLNSFELER